MVNLYHGIPPVIDVSVIALLTVIAGGRTLDNIVNRFKRHLTALLEWGYNYLYIFCCPCTFLLYRYVA